MSVQFLNLYCMYPKYSGTLAIIVLAEVLALHYFSVLRSPHCRDVLLTLTVWRQQGAHTRHASARHTPVLPQNTCSGRLIHTRRRRVAGRACLKSEARASERGLHVVLRG